MQNVIRNLFALLIVFFSLSLAIKPAYSQTDTSGAAALGKAIGTLLGNMFSSNSGSSSSSSDSQPIGNSFNEPSKESMNLYKQKDDEIFEFVKSICLRADLKSFYEKTTCNNSELTMTHFVDGSKITNEQKKSLLIVDAEYKKTADLQIENFQTNFKPPILGKQLADVRLKYRIQSQKTLQDLYLGKITWGEYNTNRRDIAQAGRDESIKISKQYGN